MPLLSVIIPTHRRPTILRQCLQHLERQTAAEKIEVIVVSDGPDAETAALFSDASWKVPVQYAEIEKSQQGSARNAGVQRATGRYVLFIGDDIFLQPHACASHLDALQQVAGSAVLGYVTWDPLAIVTPTMAWLERSGWQFGYGLLDAHRRKMIPREQQHRFSYASNISLPRDVAVQHPFRTDVSLYGWEDIEWGMRLAQDNIALFYEPTAVGLHHHHVTLEDSLRRMETIGRSAVKIAAVSDFDPRPKGWKLWIYRLLALLPTMRGRHSRAYLRGIAAA
jgi:glycosyltransferase involved in cell wall biosynthesis